MKKSSKTKPPELDDAVAPYITTAVEGEKSLHMQQLDELKVKVKNRDSKIKVLTSLLKQTILKRVNIKRKEGTIMPKPKTQIRYKTGVIDYEGNKTATAAGWLIEVSIRIFAGTKLWHEIGGFAGKAVGFYLLFTAGVIVAQRFAQAQK